MMIAVEVPAEVYDDSQPVPAVCTPQGEMLARVSEQAAGGWMGC